VERRCGVSQQLQGASAFKGMDAVMSVEFGVDVLDVGAGGVDRNDQHGGNLLNRSPSGKQVKDGALTLAQQFRNRGSDARCRKILWERI
jgi:hypothetical protein